VLKYYENILKEIIPYLQDGKNSLIIFLGDKYSGKTELLTYLYSKDINEFKFCIFVDQQDDAIKGISIIRMCFLQILTKICINDVSSLFSSISDRNFKSKISYYNVLMAKTNIKSLLRHHFKKKKKTKSNELNIENNILMQLLKLFAPCSMKDLNWIINKCILLIEK